jgi:hypothetical protein
MSTPERDVDEPLPEPGKRPAGASVGGIRATADDGLADATERSLERSVDPATGRASTGGAVGGAVAPADAAGRADFAAGEDRDADEDDDEWRLPPVAPVDEENLLKSLGRSIADAVTGGAEDTSKKPER